MQLMCFLGVLHNCLDLVQTFISDSSGITASSEQESGSFGQEYIAVSQLRKTQEKWNLGILCTALSHLPPIEKVY